MFHLLGRVWMNVKDFCNRIKWRCERDNFIKLFEAIMFNYTSPDVITEYPQLINIITTANLNDRNTRRIIISPLQHLQLKITSTNSWFTARKFQEIINYIKITKYIRVTEPKQILPNYWQYEILVALLSSGASRHFSDSNVVCMRMSRNNFIADGDFVILHARIDYVCG